MLTDKKRIELALIPNMLLAVAVDGANREDPETAECERLLARAALEPIVGLQDKEQRKILRRIVRVHDEAMSPHRQDGSLVAKSGLIAYYILRSVTDDGYMEVVQGSDLEGALAIMLPALEPAANITALDRSAIKAARKTLAHLQSQGFFVGVPFAE